MSDEAPIENPTYMEHIRHFFEPMDKACMKARGVDLDTYEGVKVNALRTYFRVMASYANNRDKLVKEIRRSTDLEEDAIREMLGKIEWFDLEENRRLQFGIERQPGEQVNDGIINTIISS